MKKIFFNLMVIIIIGITSCSKKQVVIDANPVVTQTSKTREVMVFALDGVFKYYSETDMGCKKANSKCYTIYIDHPKNKIGINVNGETDGNFEVTT